jgi:hypothetical protein
VKVPSSSLGGNILFVKSSKQKTTDSKDFFPSKKNQKLLWRCSSGNLFFDFEQVNFNFCLFDYEVALSNGRMTILFHISTEIAAKTTTAQKYGNKTPRDTAWSGFGHISPNPIRLLLQSKRTW